MLAHGEIEVVVVLGLVDRVDDFLSLLEYHAVNFVLGIFLYQCLALEELYCLCADACTCYECCY